VQAGNQAVGTRAAVANLGAAAKAAAVKVAEAAAEVVAEVAARGELYRSVPRPLSNAGTVCCVSQRA
jgi:hypothetical protein